MGADEIAQTHDGVIFCEDCRRRPLDGLHFSRVWPASVAIVVRAALLLVSAKAAFFGMRYLLPLRCGPAKVVEKVLEAHRCSHRMRASRADAAYDGAASFTGCSMAYNRRTKRHTLPPAALEMAAPRTQPPTVSARRRVQPLAPTRLTDLASVSCSPASPTIGKLCGFVGDCGRPQRESRSGGGFGPSSA